MSDSIINLTFKLLALQLLLASLAVSQDFDFFYFVQQWPGSYCDTEKSCCYPTTGKPQADFGIHGLWPNYNDGSYPSNCDPDSPFDQQKVSSLLGRMREEWPTLACPSSNGIQFWTHEWEKHGTCSESVLDQTSYFQAALNFKSQTNLLRALTTAGIEPNGQSYSLESIKDAIKEGVGYTPYIECNVDTSGNHQLYQIYLCVDSSASNLIECPIFPRGVFILPKKVMEEIDKLSRSFLWSGGEDATKMALVAWDGVCRPRKEGGLGVLRILEWNRALIGKLIWAIEQKEDVLWVRWVNHVYLKHKNWADYIPGVHTSWAWKAICKVNQLFRTQAQGRSLSQMFNRRYSVKQAYAIQVDKLPTVCWYRWTWNSWNIPKFNVICWLLCKGRLQTRDRLHNLGICTSTICPVCSNAQESIPHLFFDCIFSKKCLKKWYDWLAAEFKPRTILQCIRWLKRQRNMNHKKKRLAEALLAAVAYIIWANRNRCVWELSSNNPDRVTQRVFLQVMHRMHMRT